MLKLSLLNWEFVFSDLHIYLRKDALKVLGALVDKSVRTFVILFGIAQYTRNWGSHC